MFKLEDMHKEKSPRDVSPPAGQRKKKVGQKRGRNVEPAKGTQEHVIWLEKEAERLADFFRRHDETLTNAQWMRETMQRLREHGMTDGVCRELVAPHLPRGKGPKDRL